MFKISRNIYVCLYTCILFFAQLLMKITEIKKKPKTKNLSLKKSIANNRKELPSFILQQSFICYQHSCNKGYNRYNPRTKHRSRIRRYRYLACKYSKSTVNSFNYQHSKSKSKSILRGCNILIYRFYFKF